jgi:hypothetical protein
LLPLFTFFISPFDAQDCISVALAQQLISLSFRVSSCFPSPSPLFDAYQDSSVPPPNLSLLPSGPFTAPAPSSSASSTFFSDLLPIYVPPLPGSHLPLVQQNYALIHVEPSGVSVPELPAELQSLLCVLVWRVLEPSAIALHNKQHQLIASASSPVISTTSGVFYASSPLTNLSSSSLSASKPSLPDPHFLPASYYLPSHTVNPLPNHLEPFSIVVTDETRHRLSRIQRDFIEQHENRQRDAEMAALRKQLQEEKQQGKQSGSAAASSQPSGHTHLTHGKDLKGGDSTSFAASLPIQLPSQQSQLQASTLSTGQSLMTMMNASPTAASKFQHIEAFGLPTSSSSASSMAAKKSFDFANTASSPPGPHYGSMTSKASASKQVDPLIGSADFEYEVLANAVHSGLPSGPQHFTPLELQHALMRWMRRTLFGSKLLRDALSVTLGGIDGGSRLDIKLVCLHFCLKREFL